MQDVSNNKLCRFKTILDNLLNVGEPAGGEEGAGRPHSLAGGLLEGAGGGAKNVVAAVIYSGSNKSPARSSLRSLAAILIKTKNRKCPNCNIFLLGSSGFE